MLSETDIETSRKYDGSATVCECTITDYLSVLGPEGTESKNADGLLVVVFCRRRRIFLIWGIFCSTVLMLIGSRPHDTFFVVSGTV